MTELGDDEKKNLENIKNAAMYFYDVSSFGGARLGVPAVFPRVAFIPGRLPGANEYINACRADSRKGNEMKRDAQMLCLCGLHKLPRHNAGRVGIKFVWIEPNMHRDPDNICFAKKFILDQMQTMKIISGDGWRQIAFLQDEFRVDKENPGVKVYLYIIEES